jgi:hypothetical protein
MEELSKVLSTFEIGSPLRAWIGGALALLIVFFPLFKKTRGMALDLGSWQRTIALQSKWRWTLPVLVAVATILMAVVMADPQVTTRESVPVYGKPVMVVIDVSGSMEYTGRAGTEGLSPLEKGRKVFYDLLGRNPEADFGLLLYSTERYVARYFAFRQELLTDTLENDQEVEFIATGTRTAEALARARTFLLENMDVDDRAIVLISDMEADAEAVLQTAEELERNALAGIKVYVIITKADRRRTRGEQGNPTPIDGVRMVEMDDRQGIDEICAEIAAMKSVPVREEETLVKKSLIPFLSPLTLGLITLSLALSETCLRKLP